MSGVFICEACGKKCLSLTPDEEALAELAVNFPGLKREDAAVICDDCYEQAKRLIGGLL